MKRPASAPSPASDLRRAISRQKWLANRAGNALQRPVFIGAISIGTFVTALVSMVVVPRAQHQTHQIAVLRRPDTLSVASSVAVSRVRLAQSESALIAERVGLAAASTARRADTVAVQRVRLPDSVVSRARAFEQSLARAEQAPLASSYKAIAELPELRNDSRIRALADSLTEIEREREGFGAVGGVDPIFVALTSRANDIGRAIRAIAEERLRTLHADASRVPPPTPDTVIRPAIDTVARATERDSLRATVNALTDSLASDREISHEIDLEEERARERALAVAPPLALLASAFVLSAVIGFAAALLGELRRPRVSDANELERYLSIRVLSTMDPQTPSLERNRREADRAAPPYFDPSAEGFQLAYLALTTEHPTLLSAAVTGDDASIAAVVACNLAAVAADEARNTLVIDLEPTCSASAALRTRVRPGILDVVQQSASWSDARVPAQVGRDKSVDLVPYGGAMPMPTHELIAALRREGARFALHYDAVVVIVTPEAAADGLLSALPSPDLIYCARPGRTPLRVLREQLNKIRASGGIVRGVILWNTDRPLLPTPRELTARPTRQGPKTSRSVLSAS